jgi:hypothetical protein
MIRPATIGGGDWSAKDLVGHVAFWEEIALDQLAAWRAGEVLRFDERYGPGGVDGMNARNVALKATRSLDRVRGDSAATHEALLRELEGLTDHDWRSVPPSPTADRPRLGTRLGRILGGPGGQFSHAWAHLPDLDSYVARDVAS